MGLVYGACILLGGQLCKYDLKTVGQTPLTPPELPSGSPSSGDLAGLWSTPACPAPTCPCGPTASRASAGDPALRKEEWPLESKWMLSMWYPETQKEGPGLNGLHGHLVHMKEGPSRRTCFSLPDLILDIFACTFFYEHPYCTDSDLLLFFFLLTNVLSKSRFR